MGILRSLLNFMNKMARSISSFRLRTQELGLNRKINRNYLSCSQWQTQLKKQTNTELEWVFIKAIKHSRNCLLTIQVLKSNQNGARDLHFHSLWKINKPAEIMKPHWNFKIMTIWIKNHKFKMNPHWNLTIMIIWIKNPNAKIQTRSTVNHWKFKSLRI